MSDVESLQSKVELGFIASKAKDIRETIQPFIKKTARLALPGLIIWGTASDCISHFISPAHAETTTTASIPTWVNRCGPNTHIPFTDQSLLYSEYSVIFLVSTDTEQYLSTYQGWYNDGVNFLVQRINTFNSLRIGTRTSWDKKSPTVRNMPNTFATYRGNTNTFLSDVIANPVSVQSTPEKAAKEFNFYIVDPNLTFDDLYPNPGSWGGPSGKVGRNVLPSIALKPNLSPADKELTARLAIHEDEHINTKNPNPQGHDLDPKDITFKGANMAVPENEIFISDRDLINTCPAGEQDPVVNENVKPKLYLAITIKN